MGSFRQGASAGPGLAAQVNTERSGSTQPGTVEARGLCPLREVGLEAGFGDRTGRRITRRRETPDERCVGGPGAFLGRDSDPSGACQTRVRAGGVEEADRGGC